MRQVAEQLRRGVKTLEFQFSIGDAGLNSETLQLLGRRRFNSLLEMRGSYSSMPSPSTRYLFQFSIGDAGRARWRHVPRRA